MKELNIMRGIMMRFSRGLARLFRNNTGQGWAGEIIRRWKDESGNHYITIKNPRVLHAGLTKGSGDLIGWKTIQVTPDLIDKHLAVFVSVEVKTDKGRPTTEQNTFLDAVLNAGGIAGIVRSEEEADRLLENHRFL